MRQSRRLIIAGAALAVALLSTGAAVGLTDWQAFGGASATGRGIYGSPSVSVESTTRINPKALRFVITAPTNPSKTWVNWDVTCWKTGSYQYSMASGSFQATPPITKAITELQVSNWNLCELYVSAFTVKTGGLKLSLQAKYP
jgi:hypothetical protein